MGGLACLVVITHCEREKKGIQENISESETRAMDDIVERFLEEKLEKEIKDAQAAVAVALGPGLKTKLNSILRDCEELLNKVKEKKGTGRDKLYNLLNVITEWHDLSTQTNCPTATCSINTISNYLKQLKKDLEEEPAASEQELGEPTKPQLYRWSCHAKSLATIHGFDDRLKIMERLLLKPTPKPIGIVGMAGVGKTALCQLAYNHAPVKDHFPLRLWLCLSNNQEEACDRKDYLKVMMSCLGYEDQVIQKIGDDPKRLQVALQRHLSRGRYLVVLDDVWIEKEKDKFVMDEEIHKLFDFLNQPLGTLVVTSRSPELEEMLGADNIDVHKLLPLADRDSCLNIFNDAWEERTELSKDEKNGIVEKCGGLPLMAKMLGEIGPPPILNEKSTNNSNQ
ncbi:probable disease resistance protein At5g45490 [Salvia splendens]|uniref:probable disease resistance protein At5g45490 n=1 Tax=Salvia splendens TaxID=180675 RepID=UPI001C268884|nr:probable disease resistance protein At5g45490 [Salvia splendens]